MDKRNFSTAQERDRWLNDEHAFWTDIEGNCETEEAKNIARGMWRKINAVKKAISDGKATSLTDFQQYLPDYTERAHKYAREIYNARQFYPAAVLTLTVQFLFDHDKQRIQMPREWGYFFGLVARENFATVGDESPIRQLPAKWEPIFQDFEKRLDELISSRSKLLDDLQEKYFQIQTLKEPLTYWTKKRDEHRTASRWFGVVLFPLMVVVCLGVLCLGYWTRRDYLDASAQSQPFLLFVYSIPVVITGAILLWAIRIIARLFLTQVHLWTDAEERLAMLQTYLAMLTGKGVLDGKDAIRQSDMQLILAALFRHGADGLFKEEPSPPLLEIVAAAAAAKPR